MKTATDTLVIGGGLSGLHTAWSLRQRGIEVMLVDARNRLGGRVLSRTAGAPSAARFDLGPTWFWPGQQRMEALVRTLDLDSHVFEQPSAGDAIFEDQQGKIHRGIQGVSMAGSYRVDGGIGTIVDRLASTLPETSLRLGTRATRITPEVDGLRTTVLPAEAGATGGDDTKEEDEDEQVINSARVVIALPPRLAAETIRLSPALADDHRDALGAIPTWMAGHGKVIALYDEPFWRADGLSGDAVSYRGPLGEIHDASPRADKGNPIGTARGTDSPGALFGFLGVPAPARADRADALRKAAIEQLVRLFGPRAETPWEVWLKDWAFDPLTATSRDQTEPHAHAALPSMPALEPLWDGRLLWSGAETAHEGPRNNGYLEGALEASQRTVRHILNAAR